MLTNEMKKMLSEQLPIIATLNEDNTVNVGPKRTGRIYNDNTLIFNENTGGTTLENIKRTGQATLIVVDRAALDGYRFFCEASVYTDGKYYEDAKEFASQKGMAVPKAATVLTIKRVDTLKSGPTAGKRLI